MSLAHLSLLACLAAPLQERQVAATFYSWFDWPDRHFRGATGRDLQRHHFLDPAAVHPDSTTWFEGELAALAEAGVDVLLAVGIPPELSGRPWSAALAQAWTATRGRLVRPVQLAPLVDPLLVAAARAEVPTRVAPLDLTHADDFARFLAPVENFFRSVPAEAWARVDGRPLVVVGSAGGVGARSPDLLEQFAVRVAAACGEPPFLLVEHSWHAEGFARWRTGAGLRGPMVLDAATVAPGFDDTRSPLTSGLVRMREAGRAYQLAWARVARADVPLVIIESWNQMEDGTAIAPALEHGLAYAELTRRFADRYRSRQPIEPPPPLRFPEILPADRFAMDRPFVLADEVIWDPAQDDQGVRLAPDQGAALAFERTGDGTPCLVARPRAGEASFRVAFDLSDAFVDPVASVFQVELSVAAEVSGTMAERNEAGAAFALEPGKRTALRFHVSNLEKRADSPDFEFPVRGGPIRLFGVKVTRTAPRGASVRVGWSTGERRSPPPALRESGARAGRVIVDLAQVVRPDGTQDRARLRELTDPPATGGEYYCLTAVREPNLPRDEWRRRMTNVAQAIVQERPATRFLEILPGANHGAERGGVPDPDDYVRLLREVATAVHAISPHVALVLGGIEGVDLEWLRIIQASRATTSYDALCFLADSEWGEPGTGTFETTLRRCLAAAAENGDGGKPVFVEFGIDPPPPAWSEPAWSERLVAWLRAAAARTGRPLEPIRILDERELPLVHGARGDRLAANLRGARLDAAAAGTEEMITAANDGSVHTLILPQGELVPAPLLAALAPFVDRGGLLVCTGGEPFRRVALRDHQGAWVIDEKSTAGIAVRDELRIGLRRGTTPADESDASAAPIEWRAAPTASELAPWTGPLPPGSVLFERRAGRPNTEKGFHRYTPLIQARRDGRELGDAVALLQFQGGRNGALLLIGVAAGDPPGDEAAEAVRVTSAVNAVLASPARAVFWRIERSQPDGSSALWRADGSLTAAGEALRRRFDGTHGK